MRPASRGPSRLADNGMVGVRNALSRTGRWIWSVRRLMLLAGALLVLAFPDANLEFLAWFGLVPGLVLIVRSPTAREGGIRAWWLGAGYLIAALYWMAPEIGPAVLLVAAVVGVLWVPFGVAAWKLLRPPSSWPRALAALVVVPSCWLITEWLRSWQALGGPWAVFGVSQWQHPAVLALAALGGVWLISIALVLANVAIVLVIASLPGIGAILCPSPAALSLATLSPAEASPAVLSPAEPSTAGPTPAAPTLAGPSTARLSSVASGTAKSRAGLRPGMAILGVATGLASIGAGPLAFALTPASPAVRYVTIAMVQPGVISNASLSAHASETLTAELSRGGTLGGVRPDLIVWGESSIADDITLPKYRGLLSQIEALSAKDGAEILVHQDTTPPG